MYDDTILRGGNAEEKLYILVQLRYNFFRYFGIIPIILFMNIIDKSFVLSTCFYRAEITVLEDIVYFMSAYTLS